MVIKYLSALTPRAIQTLAGLLTNKSGYIRLEAAKDILNRTGVGAARDGSNTSPLLISIQIGDRTLGVQSGGFDGASTPSLSPEFEPGGRKSEEAEEASLAVIWRAIQRFSSICSPW